MENVSKIEDVIKEAWANNYKVARDRILYQLIELTSTLFVLEKIEAFPLNFFLPLYDDRVSWLVMRNALVERAIMISSRAITEEQDINEVEEGKEVLSLKTLKARMLANSTPEGKQVLKKRFRQIHFEATIVAEEKR